MAAKGKTAQRGCVKAAEHIERRRLAGTVGPDQAGDACGGCSKTQVTDRIHTAELFAQTLRRHRHAHPLG